MNTIENKHLPHDLPQMQSLPLEAKIRMTEQRVKQWYEYWNGKVYVARSGGKDSDVLGNIVKKLYPDVPQVFVNTGLEYDSVRLHGTEVADVVVRPEMSFLQVISKYGYPVISKEVAQTVTEVQKAVKNGKQPPKYRMDKLNGVCIDKNTGSLSSYNMPQYKFLIDAPFRISHKCCDVMKKSPSKKYERQTGNKPFLGTMATESRLRKTKWMRFGCNAFEEKRPTSQPLSFWTEQDILLYIKKNQLEIASAYGHVTVDYKSIGQCEGQLAIQDILCIKEHELIEFYSPPLKTTGANRTGCVFCMFGITQDTDRFLKLKELEPKKYDYVMRGGKFDETGMWIPHNGLGYKFVIDWLNEHGNLNIRY